MLADLADGSRDAVLIYHVDRLTRRPIELEQFLDVLTTAKVRHVKFVAGGDLDIGNGDGLMVLRMLLAVAANESATKSRRVRRKMLQNAEAGLPHGGYRRAFGYDTARVTVLAGEAQTIRTLAERFVAGERFTVRLYASQPCRQRPAALPCPSGVGILCERKSVMKPPSPTSLD